MNKKKSAIIISSCLGVFLVAALATGAMYKAYKTAEYEEYLTQQTLIQQEQLAQEAAAKAVAEKAAQAQKEIPAIKPIEEQQKENQAAADAALKEAGKTVTSSAPEITVSTDEKGNQTITEDYSKPEKPKHENIHDPESAPENSSKPGKGTVDEQIKDEDVKFDENGNQKPNAKGEIYVPGFGWMKPSGASYDTAHNAGTGEMVGQ